MALSAPMIGSGSAACPPMACRRAGPWAAAPTTVRLVFIPLLTLCGEESCSSSSPHPLLYPSSPSSSLFSPLSPHPLLSSALFSSDRRLDHVPAWEELLPLRYGDGGGPAMDYDGAGIQTRGARAAAAAVTQASASSLAPAFDEETMWHMNMRGSEPMESGPYPERPGEPDCAYYLRTGLCRYGLTCRYNHPPDRKLYID